MNRRFKFITILSLICMAVFSFSAMVNAQMEVFHWDSSKVVNGKLTLGINSDYMDTSYYSTSDVAAGIAKWTNTTANLSLSSVSFSSSNVDLATVSSSTWNNNGWGSTTYAFTDLFAGSKECSPNYYTQNCTSGDVITYGSIFFNEGYMPSGTLFGHSASDKRRALIGHELGHSFTLHHNSVIGQDSIMKTTAWNEANFSYDPSAADVQDINSVYN